MTEPGMVHYKRRRMVRMLLGSAVGYVAGGFVGLLVGRVLSHSQIQFFQVLDMVKAYTIGVVLGALLGAAIGVLTGRQYAVPGRDK